MEDNNKEATKIAAIKALGTNFYYLTQLYNNSGSAFEKQKLREGMEKVNNDIINFTK